MAHHRESLEGAAQATSNTILLVEDDPSIRSVLVEAIALETPYRAVVASDGNTALHIVQHSSPCLFVLDYGLPGMNGIELYDRLHANPELARIPTIFITADRTISQQQIRQRQLIAFLKPFDLEAFLATIEALLTAP